MPAMVATMRLSFAGHDLVALSDGALFWPSRGALLVADLHLEKASWFARAGQMLPPYDSLATVESLERLVERWHPREIWALGDSFHDADGPTRLCRQAGARLATLMQATHWTWITGNHDAGHAAALGGAVAVEALVDGVVLRHEADPHERRPEMSGHFHPKLRISARGRSVSRRCFIAGERRLILPAFGALTGGLDAAAAPLRALAGPLGRALVPAGGRLLAFPLG